MSGTNIYITKKKDTKSVSQLSVASSMSPYLAPYYWLAFFCCILTARKNDESERVARGTYLEMTNVPDAIHVYRHPRDNGKRVLSEL